MIKAIIFDYFGVLVTEGLTNFIDHYFKVDSKEHRTANELVKDLNKGNISYDIFIAELSKLAKVEENITREFLDSEKANVRLLEFIENELKPRYKLGILSNAGGDWVNEQLGPKNADLFDEVMLSYKYKLIKPDPKFYKLMTVKLKVEPGECVFIDDIEKYCIGAERVGIKAIQFKNNFQIKEELAKYINA